MAVRALARAMRGHPRRFRLCCHLTDGPRDDPLIPSVGEYRPDQAGGRAIGDLSGVPAVH